MNSRDAMLDSLRRNAPPVSPLPETPAAIAYAEPEKQFAEAFTSVGGQFVRVTGLAEINTELEKLESYTQARKIASLIPDIGRANVDLAALKDPHRARGDRYRHYRRRIRRRGERRGVGAGKRPRSASRDLRGYSAPCAGRAGQPNCPYHAGGV